MTSWELISKKPDVYPDYTNIFPSWLKVWLKIANNSTAERARSNWYDLQQLMDLGIKLMAGSQFWCLPAHPALSNPSTAPLSSLQSWRDPQGETRQACNSHEVELFKFILLLGKEARQNLLKLF